MLMQIIAVVAGIWLANNLHFSFGKKKDEQEEPVKPVEVVKPTEPEVPKEKTSTKVSNWFKGE